MDPPVVSQPNLQFLLRILFIYQKLEEGWEVRKIGDNKFEFKKNTV